MAEVMGRFLHRPGMSFRLLVVRMSTRLMDERLLLDKSSNIIHKSRTHNHLAGMPMWVA